MTLVLMQYTDAEGFKYRSFVRDLPGEDPRWGIPCGIPQISSLLLAEDEKLVLHNALFDAELFTYDDVLDSKGGLTALLKQIKFESVRKQLIVLYKVEKLLASGGS